MQHKIDIDLAALNQLPEDGNLTGLCKAVTETNVDEEELKPKEDEEETPSSIVEDRKFRSNILLLGLPQEILLSMSLPPRDTCHVHSLPWCR